MVKLLFVCHGNICRSPMAEFVMKNIVAQAGWGAEFEIGSAATSREELGNAIYPPVRRILHAHGIDFADKRAVQLTRADYGYYDYLIGMDGHNLRNMNRICGGDPDKKMALLLDFTNRPGDISDPWYSGDFDATFRDVLEGCRGLLSHLSKKQGLPC